MRQALEGTLPEQELMPHRRTFLDIQSSVTGQRWVERLDVRQANVALAIAQHHAASDIVARILAGRGVGIDEAPAFLHPTIKALMPDPRTLTDMERAAERLAEAIVTREPVAIFGDYDVDGASSSALLSRFLEHFDVPNEIYIPDRIFEGYGPNPAAMGELASRARLIVTVDCGTNSAVAIAAAKAAGADVLVLDHHQVAGELPDGVPVVNPNREDDMSGLGYLCAAGVVFMTLVETARMLRERGGFSAPDLMSMLDLVALATVCDVVPLTGLNRAFVVSGLKIARQMDNKGLEALVKVSRIGEPLNPFHFGFLIGPRINAGGRIGDAALGARLLTLHDISEAERIAAELDRLNAERQAMEKHMLEDAENEVAAELADGQGPAILVTGHDKWHPGIVGLIAARLKERAQRPAFAIAFNPAGLGTGSGRSIAGFDLGRLVRKAHEAGLIVKGGGHAMAAGITVERAKLGDLRAFFETEAAAQVGKLRETAVLEVDGAIGASGATINLLEEMERAGPYGSGHPAPVIVLPNHRLNFAKVVGAGGHIKMSFSLMDKTALDAILFRGQGTALGDFLFSNIGERMHVAGTLSVNHFNGRRTVQMRVLDAAAVTAI
jgi:single-stranded-DNA-specific exonuclease